MNILLSCIGKRGYIADYFRSHLSSADRIIGTSNSPWTPGLLACDRGIIMPPISSDEYPDAVVEACHRHEISLLLSFYDPDVMALSRIRDRIASTGCVPFIPSESATRIAYDKQHMFDTLSESGYSVPYSASSLENAVAAIEAGDLAFPLIVKPRRGFGSTGTFIAKDMDQLRIFSKQDNVLVQQFVDGEELNISCLADLAARPLSIVPCRKLAMAGGETQHAITIDHAGLMDLGQRLIGDLSLVGPVDVDFIESSDGRIHVIDINPRFGGTYPLAHLAGADFPAAIVGIVRGTPPAPYLGRFERDTYMMKSIEILGGALRDIEGARST